MNEGHPRGENTMKSIATETTGTEIGIGPPTTLSGGIEEEAQTGGDKKLVGRGRIMSGEGLRPVTEVMNGIGTDRENDIVTVTADDHLLPRDPIEKITREREVGPPAKTEKDLAGKRIGNGGLKKPAERIAIPPSRTRSLKRLLLKRTRKMKRTC